MQPVELFLVAHRNIHSISLLMLPQIDPLPQPQPQKDRFALSLVITQNGIIGDRALTAFDQFKIVVDVSRIGTKQKPKESLSYNSFRDCCSPKLGDLVVPYGICHAPNEPYPASLK